MTIDLSTALDASLQPAAVAPAFFNYIRTYVDLQIATGLAGVNLTGGSGPRMARRVLVGARTGQVLYHGMNTDSVFATCRLNGTVPDPLAYVIPIIVGGVVDRNNVQFVCPDDGADWNGAVEMIAVTITTQAT